MEKTGSLIYAFILILSISNPLFIVPIKVPLGSIPFPYLFWLSAFIYSVFNYKFLKLPLDKSLIFRTVIFGAFFHIMMLLIKLNNDEYLGLISFASIIYKAYFRLFAIFIFLSFTVFVAYRALRRGAGGASGPLYSVPLLGLWLYLLLSTFNQRQYGQLFWYVTIAISTAILTANKSYFERLKGLIIKFKLFILSPRIFLSFVFIAAIAIRVIYLVRTMTDPNYLLTGADAYNYDRLARTYLGTGIPLAESLPLLEVWNWLAHIGSWQYVALFYKIFNFSYFAFCFVQGLLGAVSCILVYFIAKYIFNETVARISAITAMLNFSMVFSSIVIDNMGLNIFCTTATMFMLCKYHEGNLKSNSRHVALLIFVGLLNGMLIATFYNNIILLFIVLIWLFLVDFRIKKTGVIKSLMHGGVVILFAAGVIGVSIFLFGIGNVKSFSARLISGSFDTRKFYSGYFGGKEISEFPEMISLGLGSAPEILLYLIPVIIKKGLPAVIIILNFFVKSFSELFFSQGYGGFDPIFLIRTSDYFYCLWFYAYILTAFGVVVSVFKRRLCRHSIVALLLYLYITYTAAIHILFFRAAYRYRALMEPYLISFGSFGWWFLYQNTKRRQKT